MADTLVGLYRTLDDAQQVITQLRDAGIRREDVSLVAQDMDGEYARYFSQASGSEGSSDTGSGTGKSTGIGAVLGGAAGLLFGLGILAVPGLGPVMAAGPIVGALAGAGVGAAAGGLVGALTDAGVPEQDATLYAQGVRRGGILMAVHAPSELSDRALQVMNRHNPMDVSEQMSGQNNQANSGYSTVAPDLDERSVHGRIASDTVQGDVRGSEQSGMPDALRNDRSSNLDNLPDLHPGATLEDTSTGQRDWVPGTPDAHPRMSIAKSPDATAHDRPYNDMPASVDPDILDDQARIRAEQVDVRRPPHNPKISDADIGPFPGEDDQSAHSSDRMVSEVINPEEKIEQNKDTVQQRSLGGVVKTYDSSSFYNHYQQRYAHGGLGFDDYLPAYRYGYELGNGEQYRGREWPQIEESVRRDWERVYPKTEWDEYRDAVYEGWRSVRSKFG